MYPPSDESEPPPLVCVIDTSVIIKLKTLVRIDEQWAIFEHMLQLVQDGRLVFPRQVYKEIAFARHPDAPGAWIARARTLVCQPEPTDETMAEILHITAPLVQENAEPANEPADPYVVAMAHELSRANPPRDVVVATNDVIDRPPLKMALKTACDQLDITCWTAEVFLQWVRDTRPTDPGE
ncbi:DUF4411 family protein [Kribbella sp. NBC_00482]|uniref:DUF4411 family protein n=1 Tax=Kribbella sp. NBC_00482 TaxID=2975968 RepID=UPI002E19AC09